MGAHWPAQLLDLGFESLHCYVQRGDNDLRGHAAAG